MKLYPLLLLGLLLNLGDVYSCELSMKVDIVQKENLEFSTSESSMDRINEAFVMGKTSASIQRLIEDTVCEATKLIDSAYLPEKISIHLENKAMVTGPDYLEHIPSSLVLSQQVPRENTIVMGMFELTEDRQAFRSILAHELGHMLVEWISRKSGVTKTNQSSLSFWSKPIYEGVADFTAACITHSTVVGSHHLWFKRDILEYTSLLESQNPSLSMGEMIQVAFESLNLIPEHQFYKNWLATINLFLKQTNAKDPYSEGTWIAGQLWQISKECKNKERIWAVLTRLARTGENFQSSDLFVEKVKKLTL